jgi:hypothetical protein
MAKGATSSGGGKSNRRNQDQSRAAYMQKHPGQFPDSVMKGFTGHGLEAGVRALLFRHFGHSSRRNKNV